MIATLATIQNWKKKNCYQLIPFAILATQKPCRAHSSVGQFLIFINIQKASYLKILFFHLYIAYQYFLKSSFWYLPSINLLEWLANQVIDNFFDFSGKNCMVCIKGWFLQELVKNCFLQCQGWLLSQKKTIFSFFNSLKKDKSQKLLSMNV